MCGSTTEAPVVPQQPQAFFSLLGQHVKHSQAHGWSLSGSSHMFCPLIRSDKPYCVYSNCLPFTHSHTHPDWEVLCYTLRHPGACHVCGNDEFILLFVFPSPVWIWGITCVRRKPAHLQTWRLCRRIRILNLGGEGGSAGLKVLRRVSNMN